MDYQLHTQHYGVNPYTDNYTGFTWRDTHSSTYNCFIENTGHLEFVPAPEFSNNAVAPAFQNRTYYTGTTIGNRRLNFNIVFCGITLRELNKALHWLDLLAIGDLFFDYDDYWKYQCKISAFNTMEQHVIGHCMESGRKQDLYLIKCAIVFETVYNSNAISTYNQTLPKDCADFENGELNPLIHSENETGDIYELNNNTIILDNSLYGKPRSFNIHLYNFNQSLLEIKTLALLDRPETSPFVSENELFTPIQAVCVASFNFDQGDQINIHYNSELGLLTSCGRLAQQLLKADGSQLCTQASVLPNIQAPAYGYLAIQLNRTDYQFIIESNNNNYVV